MSEEINGKELYDANVIVGSDNGDIIEFLLMFDDLDAEAAQLRIYKKRYDENEGENGGFVPDAESFKAALDQLEFLGVDKEKVDEFRSENDEDLDLNADLSDLVNELEDTQVYFNGDRASTKPIKNFVRFDPITAKVAKALKEASKKDAVFKSHPIVINENQLKFNIILKANLEKYGLSENDTDNPHPIKNIKVAQIAHPDGVSNPYSIKYHDASANKYLKGIDEGEYPEEKIPQIKQAVKTLTEKSFERKLKQLSELFGYDDPEDFKQAIEDEEEFYFKVDSVNSISNNKGTFYFIDAKIVDEDEYSDDSEVTE